MVRASPVFKKLQNHYLLIVVASLVVHGLLLLNDGLYYDGWVIYGHAAEKDWTEFNTWITGVGGVPTIGYIHWLLGYLPSTILAYKVIAFLSITLSAILVYSICKELKLLGRMECLFIALISLCYPAFQVWVELIVLPYLICYCLFFLACFIAVKSEGASGFKHYGLRIGSLAVFVLSFTIKSLLPFYFGFLLILALYCQRARGLSLKEVFRRWLPHRMDYVLLPIAYWVVDRVVFPARGFYVEAYPYNELSLSISGFILNSGAFVIRAIILQALQPLVILIMLPSLVLVAVVWLRSTLAQSPLEQRVPSRLSQSSPKSQTRRRKRHAPHRPDGKRPSYMLLLFGFVLLVLGILPYALVDKAPNAHGYETRHALLVGLPMAVIVVAVVRLLFADKKGAISRLGLVLLASLALAFGCTQVATYVSWQARWVKDRSTMVNLRDLPNAEEVSVFWVDDKYQNEFRLGGESEYMFYEWAAIFEKVWGDEAHVGVSEDQRSFWLQGYERLYSKYRGFLHLSEFDPAGCQATLTIERGPDLSSNAGLCCRYFYYRFIEKDHLTEFLRGVTSVQVQPISAPEAVDCPGG